VTMASLDVARPFTPAARQTSTDQQLVELWLHGRSRHTQRAYRADVGRFLAFVATPLPAVTLGDLQTFADALAQQDLAPSSRVRTLAAIKSLLAFGQRTGYLPLNVGAALKLPPKKDRLAERILSETQVHRILALEPSKRNQALLRLLYESAARANEILSLDVADLDLPNKRARVRSKGGAIEWVFWQTGAALLLPRLLSGRTTGPVFLADRQPTRVVPSVDLCPSWGAAGCPTAAPPRCSATPPRGGRSTSCGTPR